MISECFQSSPGRRRVGLWGQQCCFAVSRPLCLAVKGVGGGSWCEALFEGSRAPRTLFLISTPRCLLGFVWSLGSGLSHDCLSHSAVPRALSEEQVNAEDFTAPPLTATVNQMLQARQEIEKLPGEQNTFLCVTYQILNALKAAAALSDLILSVGVCVIKSCVTFLARQGL